MRSQSRRRLFGEIRSDVFLLIQGRVESGNGPAGAHTFEEPLVGERRQLETIAIEAEVEHRVNRDKEGAAILAAQRHHVEESFVTNCREIRRDVSGLDWVNVVNAVRLPLAAIDLERGFIVRIDPVADEIRIPADARIVVTGVEAQDQTARAHHGHDEHEQQVFQTAHDLLDTRETEESEITVFTTEARSTRRRAEDRSRRALRGSCQERSLAEEREQS